VDQAALLGMINHLNGLGLPLLSVRCLPTPMEDEPSEQEDAWTELPSRPSVTVEGTAKEEEIMIQE
jgi:hypothetical protein